MIHVVVVEDDMDVAYLMMNMLSRDESFDAVHVATASAAMTEDVWTFNEGSQVVGVIDLMMPEYTGIEVAAWVRENFGDSIPLLAMTAADSRNAIFKEAVASGHFNEVVTKPAVPRVLIEQIQHLAVEHGR